MNALDRVSITRLTKYIKDNVETTLNQFVFKPNDALTRNKIVSSISSFLEDVKSRRGLEQYLIICDNSNNPPSVIKDNLLQCDIIFQPNYSFDLVNMRGVINSKELVLNSSILTKEDHYEAYERAMVILGRK